MNVQLTGINELRVALRGKTDLAAARRVVRRNGAQLQQKARKNAPVDTGFLRRSIGLKFSQGGLTATCAAGADYAPYQEWGTRCMTAHPFMKPAFAGQKAQFLRDMKQLVR